MDLNEAKEKYKKLYIEYSIRKGTSIPEMDELFNIILDGFNDSNVKMDEFIQSIVDENTVKEPTEIDKLRQENEELKQRQEMAEEALLTLSDMLLSR
ncbi:hypothetical protein [Enterococcus casseliflavus]|uniref:hypothetical protein n=1 Tax=Enterococcus casseliflavus TaxID=37734 RepID=UPI003D102386